MTQPRKASDREPPCPFCYAYRKVRQPLVFQVRDGWWECPLCLARTYSPDEDEEAIRRDMLALMEEKAGALYPNGDRAPIGRPDKHGGSKSGRRRKKPRKTHRSRDPVADAAMDARLLKKHNQKARRKAE